MIEETIYVRKRLWWWTASTMAFTYVSGPDYFRARTRERAVEKCRVANRPFAERRADKLSAAGWEVVK